VTSTQPLFVHATAFIVSAPATGAPAAAKSASMSLRKNKQQHPHIIRGGATTSTKATSLKASIGFDNTPFLQSQLVFAVANVGGFVISLLTKKQYHVDLLGTSAFGFAALLPYLLGSGVVANARIRLSACCVALWSFKLAAFLLYRCVQKGGVDQRLADILTVPKYSAGFWLFSLLWGCLCSLPHTIGATSSAAGNPLALQIGAALFGLGWTIETVADYQKWNFKNAASANSEFCNVGLWSVSQHPNWFGNLVLWAGILVMNAPAMIEPAASWTNSASTGVSWYGNLWRYRRVLVALLSPMFMWYLFQGQATGAILEDSLKETRERYGYGVDPDYTKYVDETPLIIPHNLVALLLQLFASTST